MDNPLKTDQTGTGAVSRAGSCLSTWSSESIDRNAIGFADRKKVGDLDLFRICLELVKVYLS